MTRFTSALRALSCLAAVGLLPVGRPSLNAADALPGYVALPLADTLTHLAVIRATIDGHPTSLIVDTGAAATTLDRRLYKGVLTASADPGASILPAGLPKTTRVNNVTAAVGQIQNLRAGAMRFGNGPVLVMDLSGMFGDYNNSHNRGAIGGLIGEDVLTTYGAIIDWRRRGIYFNTDASKRIHPGKSLVAAGWTAVPMHRTNGRHFAVSCVIDHRPFQLIVDTGAAFTLLDVGLLGSRDVINSHGALRMGGIGGDALTRPVMLTDWMIGDYRIASYPVGATKLPDYFLSETAGGAGPMLGLLGSEVLSHNSAIIDIAGSTLYLKPAAAKAR